LKAHSDAGYTFASSTRRRHNSISLQPRRRMKDAHEGTSRPFRSTAIRHPPPSKALFGLPMPPVSNAMIAKVGAAAWRRKLDAPTSPHEASLDDLRVAVDPVPFPYPPAVVRERLLDRPRA